MDERRTLERLKAALDSARDLLILPHNDPDPDAIASAVALQYLLEHHFEAHAGIRYSGIIGRAENRALVDYLGHDIQPLLSALPSLPIILVDTQPGAGNNPLPAGNAVLAVVDHHPLRPATEEAAFADVRPHFGACATIVANYLRASGLALPTTLATALFYGIRSDTMALGRNVDQADVEAYIYLQALVDTDALIEIEQAQVPPAYFHSFNKALEAARVYGDVLIADIGVMAYPDLVAELADWLLRLQGIDWAICIGIYHNSLRLAVRTRRHDGGAGHVAQTIVGGDGLAGGHGTMAGGQIALHEQSAATISGRLRRRILNYFQLPADVGRRLMRLTE